MKNIISGKWTSFTLFSKLIMPETIQPWQGNRNLGHEINREKLQKLKATNETG